MIKVAAIIDRISTLKDRSMKITFVTQEVSKDAGAELLDLQSKLGWLIFSANDVNEIELPEDPAADFRGEEKTPSQRLRNVIYRYWEKLGKPGDFGDYYRAAINRFVEEYKERL